MSYFKAKMHQIRFREMERPRLSSGAPPQTPLAMGSSQRSPRSPNWIKGVLLLREGEGEGKEERTGRGGKAKGREGKGERRGKEGREGGRGGLRHGCWGIDAPGRRCTLG